MAEESKSSEAMAAAVVGQAEIEARGAAASAHLVDSAYPTAITGQLVPWSGQVQGEVQSFMGCLRDVSSTAGEMSSGWHFPAKRVRGLVTAAADCTSSRDCASVFLTCALFTPTFRGRLGTWGTSGHLSVLRCRLQTHAKRHWASTGRTYRRCFVSWVDFRVRCDTPAFLQDCTVSMTNQRVASIRVRCLRLCLQTIAVGDHREPPVGDQVYPSYIARFQA